MRILVQRASQARVDIDGAISAEVLDKGLVCLVGFHRDDGEPLLEPMAEKLINLRVFSDLSGKMNRSLLDVQGGLLLISQFTLHANLRKGRRPSFMEAMEPEAAKIMNDKFSELCKSIVPVVYTGQFGAQMRVHLVNEGPVTLMLDSRELGIA